MHPAQVHLKPFVRRGQVPSSSSSQMPSQSHLLQEDVPGTQAGEEQVTNLQLKESPSCKPVAYISKCLCDTLCARADRQTLLMGQCTALPSWWTTSAQAIPVVIYLLYTRHAVQLENQWCCKCGKAPCHWLVWKSVYSPWSKNKIIESTAHSIHLLLQCSQGCTAKGWSYTIKITFLFHPTVRFLQLFIWEKKSSVFS